MFDSLLNPDNPVMQFITKVTYCVYLNILWFLCCLPIVTAGASTTALFYVTLKMVNNEEGHLTAAFFRSFKENFKLATKVWLILLAGGIFLAVDGYVLYHMYLENAFWTVLSAIFLVVLAAYALILMYIFPLMARFDNTVFAMFKNSLFIGVRFLLCSFLMVLIYFVMLLIIVRFFTPIVIFGEGLCAYLCSYMLKNILLLCEGRKDSDDSMEESKEVEAL